MGLRALAVRPRAARHLHRHHARPVEQGRQHPHLGRPPRRDGERQEAAALERWPQSMRRKSTPLARQDARAREGCGDEIRENYRQQFRARLATKESMGLADGRGSQGVEFCIHAKFSILQKKKKKKKKKNLLFRILSISCLSLSKLRI